MPAAARQSDMHTCPKVEPGPTPHVGGPIQTGSGDVDIEFLPAARAGDDAGLCQAGGPDTIQQGCGTVSINFKPAARVGDMTAHGGVIVAGAGTVEIGEAGDTVTIGPIESGSCAGPSCGAGNGEGSGDGGGDGGGDGESSGSPDTAPVSSVEVDPVAAFEVFDVAENMKIGGQGAFGTGIFGKRYRAVSTSFDPDDGDGTVPNEGIVQWSWFVQVVGNSMYNVEGTGSSIEFTVPQYSPKTDVQEVRIHLTVLDNDASPRTNKTRWTMRLRPKRPCDDKAKIKAVSDKLNSIYSRLQSLGFVWSPNAFSKWLSGSGGELWYDSDWFRSYGRVQEAESAVDNVVRRSIREQLVGLGIGSHQLYARQRKSYEAYDITFVIKSAVAFGDDLAASWGAGRIVAQAHCNITVFPDGHFTGIGRVSYEGQDRYDWNPGGWLPLPVPLMSIGGHYTWDDDDGLLMEDCMSPAPRGFFNRTGWTRSLQLDGRADLGSASTEHGLPDTTADSHVVQRVTSYSLQISEM